jgi:NDP-sugar pyrophosphorylase family protein
MSGSSGIVERAYRPCLHTLDVLILAGGLGTRLQSVLRDVPKLLAPIGDRPYIAYLLAWLRGFGARRIVLSLGYKAEAVIDYLREHEYLGLDLETIIEPRPLGTAGAIRFARASLRTEPVLALNGDSCVNADLCAFVERYRAERLRASILCTEVDAAGRYGRVVVDRDKCIREFVEKDPNFRGRATVNAGVYLLSAVLLNEIAAGKAVSLEHDVFELEPAGTIGAFVGNFEFVDIGTPASLAGAKPVLDRFITFDEQPISST